MRLTRLFTLVLLVSFVFLVMLIDMTKSYKSIAGMVSKSVHPVPAAVLHLK